MIGPSHPDCRADPGGVGHFSIEIGGANRAASHAQKNLVRMENSGNQVTEKCMAKNGHGGRRLGAGRPKKFALSSAPVAWLAELSRLCGPDTKRVTTSEGFADVILNL